MTAYRVHAHISTRWFHLYEMVCSDEVTDVGTEAEQVRTVSRYSPRGWLGSVYVEWEVKPLFSQLIQYKVV